MDDLKALFPVCKEIKSDGIRCGSPAMKGMNFCFNHIGGKPAAFIRAQATTTYKTDLNLAHPGTREAIQHNLFLVADAMNQGKIDAQTAKAYIRLYSIAEQNLTRWEKAHKNDPDKQMLPLFEEDVPSDVIPSEHNENSGAPSFRAASPRERVGDREIPSVPSVPSVVNPSQDPRDNLGAPCLAETWEHNSNQRSEAPSVPSVVNPSQDPRDNPGAPCLAETWDHNSTQRSETPSVSSVVNPSQDQRENPGAPSFRAASPRDRVGEPGAPSFRAASPRDRVGEHSSPPPAPEDLSYNEAMAAQHVARTGRPLTAMGRIYFGLPPAQPEQAPTGS